MSECICRLFVQESWGGFFLPFYTQLALCCLGWDWVQLKKQHRLAEGVSLPLVAPSKLGHLELWDKTKQGWWKAVLWYINCFWGPQESPQRKFHPSTSLGAKTNALHFGNKGRKKEGREGGNLSFSCTYTVPGTELGIFTHNQTHSSPVSFYHTQLSGRRDSRHPEGQLQWNWC